MLFQIPLSSRSTPPSRPKLVPKIRTHVPSTIARLGPSKAQVVCPQVRGNGSIEVFPAAGPFSGSTPCCEKPRECRPPWIGPHSSLPRFREEERDTLLPDRKWRAHPKGGGRNAARVLLVCSACAAIYTRVVAPAVGRADILGWDWERRLAIMES